MRFSWPPRSFSLIELLIVVAIIAALLAVALPTHARVRALAARQVCKHQLWQVREAIAAYQTERQEFPRASVNPSMNPAPLNTTVFFADVIAPFIAHEPRVLRCPRDDGNPSFFETERSSYVYRFFTRGEAVVWRLHAGELMVEDEDAYFLEEYAPFHDQGATP